MKTNREILIVEADARTGAAMADALTAAGHSCALASSGAEALACGERAHTPFDLAVLDARLREPGDALLLARLRTKGYFPAMVTAESGGEEDVIRLLDAGAEDYLMKPFAMELLVARANLLLKRFSGRQPHTRLSHRELALNPMKMEVTFAGQPLDLTPREFRILELMLSAPAGRVFSKEDICAYVWGDDSYGLDKTVNVHICNIRRKLRAITSEDYIETIWGFGYRLG